MPRPSRWTHGMQVVTILLAGLTLSAQALAAMLSGNDLVKATLVSDVSSVKAGQPFTLGVWLKSTFFSPQSEAISQGTVLFLRGFCLTNFNLTDSNGTAHLNL